MVMKIIMWLTNGNHLLLLFALCHARLLAAAAVNRFVI